ncbi:MAG: F0F1 ATP synthase subunit delta [Beijerinckiaceae bacterium]
MAQEETIVSGMTGRYAQALFALAQEKGTTDAVLADLQKFETLANLNSDMQRFVKSPVFSAEDQVKALKVLLPKAGITGIAANFVQLVASKRRLFAVDAMIADLRKLSDAAKGIARARVTVAEAMTPQHLASLKHELSGITGGKSVDVTVKIDPAIIGGMIVQLGSRMVDGSLKTKLNAIRTKMKEVG